MKCEMYKASLIHTKLYPHERGNLAWPQILTPTYFHSFLTQIPTDLHFASLLAKSPIRLHSCKDERESESKAWLAKMTIECTVVAFYLNLGMLFNCI